MPTITPSDGGYNFYKRAAEDLEEDYRSQRKRSNESEARRISDLEEKHEANLKQKEEESSRAIEKAKEEAAATLTRERDTSKQDLDKMKRQTYDRFGRFSGEESEALKTQVEELTKQAESDKQAHARRVSEIEKNSEKRNSDLRDRYQNESKDGIERAKNSASERISEIERSTAITSGDERRKTQDSYSKLMDAAREDATNAKIEADHAIADTIAAAKRNDDKRTENTEKRITDWQRAQEEKGSNSLDTMRKSHARETGALRDQIKTLVDSEKDYIRSKNQGTADAVSEFESVWKTREGALNGAFKDEVAKLKDQAVTSDRYYAQLNDRNLRDKEIEFTKISRKQGQDFQSAKRRSEDGFQEEFKQQNELHKRELAADNKYFQSQFSKMSQDREEALASQAKTFQKTLNQSKEADRDTIAQLEGALTTQKTTSDPNEVSPAAAATIRDGMMKDFEEVITKEQERDDAKFQGMDEHHRELLRGQKEEFRSKERELVRQMTTDRHAADVEKVQAAEDFLADKDFAIKEKESQHSRETDMLFRAYSATLEKQRRQYEEMLTTQRNESMARQAALRQDLEFQVRMANRTGSARQNELIREYEKKILDQKTEYDSTLQDTKERYDKERRETEQKNRVALEQQARTYEQKMAQMESQNKERERFVRSSYEEEIEKLKQSNSMLIKKKA